MQGPSNGREAARFLGQYAKRYGAGAFAVPTAAEIDKLMNDRSPIPRSGAWHWWDGAAAVSRWLRRVSTRRDFTGRAYSVWGNVITHLACEPGVELPRLDRFDCVFSYLDDHHVRDQLAGQRREIAAVRVSASSELIGCWGGPGWGHTYDLVDEATIVQLQGVEFGEDLQRAILDELTGVDQWYDDYPYYSDGSWDAVSLRGFNPSDPTWGVKPAEMGSKWLDAHPEARNHTRCEWTTLAAECPAMVEAVHHVTHRWSGSLERVRLLRMQGRGGRGGSLARHSDITDKAAGTADRHIVRLHLPLVTDPRITMTAWNLQGERIETHLPPWTLWYLDARKPHAVDNRAGIDRVHLTIDIESDAALRHSIIQGTSVAA